MLVTVLAATRSNCVSAPWSVIAFWKAIVERFWGPPGAEAVTGSGNGLPMPTVRRSRNLTVTATKVTNGMRWEERIIEMDEKINTVQTNVRKDQS